MNAQALKKLQELAIDIDAVAGLIADTQKHVLSGMASMNILKIRTSPNNPK